MKLYHFTVGELAALLEHIHGNVALIMEDGVAFALNSKLSQLYALRMLMNQSHDGYLSPELRVERAEDRELNPHLIFLETPPLRLTEKGK